MTVADSTVPHWAKCSRRASEVVEYDRPPTYSLTAMGPPLVPGRTFLSWSIAWLYGSPPNGPWSYSEPLPRQLGARPEGVGPAGLPGRRWLSSRPFPRCGPVSAMRAALRVRTRPPKFPARGLPPWAMRRRDGTVGV